MICNNDLIKKIASEYKGQLFGAGTLRKMLVRENYHGVNIWKTYGQVLYSFEYNMNGDMIAFKYHEDCLSAIDKCLADDKCLAESKQQVTKEEKKDKVNLRANKNIILAITQGKGR